MPDEWSVLTFLVPALLWLIAVRLWVICVENTADSGCKLPLPPGSVGLPFVGESLELAWKGYSFFKDRRSLFGRVYKTHILGRPTIRVFGSNNIKKILKSEEVGVSMQWPHSVKMIIGENSLMASSGELHHIRRSCLLNALSEQAVNAYLPRIQTTVREHIAKWVRLGSILGGKESRYLSTHLATQCILGYEYSQREIYQLSECLETMERGFLSLPFNITGSSLSKGIESKHYLLEMIDKAINHCRQRVESERQRPRNADSVLSVLLSSSGRDQLTIDEVKDTCVEMIFSTVEGVSSAICTMLIQLGHHGQATELACQELFHLDLIDIQRDGDLTLNKMADLHYIRRIIKEILRLTPPMGGGYRHVLRTMEIDGYQIPKGWTVLYSIRDQHDTGSDNCKQFDPDRWLPQRDITKVDEYLYIPFGGPGKRSCVGEKFAVLCLEVIAAEAVRNCQWSLMDANPAMKYFPVPYPSDGLPLTISEAPPFRQRRITL